MEKISLTDFAEWCEQKPADEAYDYWDAHACACAQYCEARGFDYSRFDTFEAEGLACNGEKGERTFGALAKRVRAAAGAGV